MTGHQNTPENGMGIGTLAYVVAAIGFSGDHSRTVRHRLRPMSYHEQLERHL